MNAVDIKEVMLYAEDDLDDFESLEDAIKQETDRYSLVLVRTGLEVISYLERNPAPCLIVLDLNMPQMDGKETLVWLKQHPKFKNIPVMVFTTSSREQDMQLCKNHNCTLFKKPSLYRDLLHVAQVMQNMAFK